MDEGKEHQEIIIIIVFESLPELVHLVSFLDRDYWSVYAKSFIGEVLESTAKNISWPCQMGHRLTSNTRSVANWPLAGSILRDSHLVCPVSRKVLERE